MKSWLEELLDVPYVLFENCMPYRAISGMADNLWTFCFWEVMQMHRMMQSFEPSESSLEIVLAQERDAFCCQRMVRF